MTTTQQHADPGMSISQAERDTEKLLCRLDESSCVLPVVTEHLIEPINQLADEAAEMKAAEEQRQSDRAEARVERAERWRGWMRRLIGVVTFGLAGGPPIRHG